MTDAWDSLTTLSETYTCYSSAVAMWRALGGDGWAEAVEPGLWLTLTEDAPGRFGFVHFRPGLRTDLGLRRTGAGDPAEALDGVLAEARRSGRVIVAGDGFHLPWHVAHERAHVPHWFVLVAEGERLTVWDPFACRNELGVQAAARSAVAPGELPALLEGLPGDDPVLALRERFALGDDAGAGLGARYQWYVSEAVETVTTPAGASGPEAILALAGHFRARGQDPAAYAQADDIWSIARHRAFLHAHACGLAESSGDQVLAAWVEEHAKPLVTRWGHIAPLLMQATLSLRAGRPASDSVPERLEALAELERAAAGRAPVAIITIT
jgi:hypothetical protein